MNPPPPVKNPKRKHLQPKELQILQRLARGWNYAHIAQQLKISPECLYVHCSHIRQKTGIRDTKDPQECLRYIRETATYTPASRREKPPTGKQLEVMELFAQGHGYDQIAAALIMGRQTAQNHLCAGCKRAHVEGSGPYEGRREHIARYLAQRMVPGDPMADPAF